MVQCENTECDQYEIPKDSAGFDPDTIICGGCGGPVTPIEPDAE